MLTTSKHFKDLEKRLDSFKTAREWSDFISMLNDVDKIIQDLPNTDTNLTICTVCISKVELNLDPKYDFIYGCQDSSQTINDDFNEINDNRKRDILGPYKNIQLNDGNTNLMDVDAFLRLHIPVHMLYKRLNQCLNTSLPAGVHNRVMKVYLHLLEKINLWINCAKENDCNLKNKLRTEDQEYKHKYNPNNIKNTDFNGEKNFNIEDNKISPDLNKTENKNKESKVLNFGKKILNKSLTNLKTLVDKNKKSKETKYLQTSIKKYHNSCHNLLSTIIDNILSGLFTFFYNSKLPTKPKHLTVIESLLNLDLPFYKYYRVLFVSLLPALDEDIEIESRACNLVMKMYDQNYNDFSEFYKIEMFWNALFEVFLDVKQLRIQVCVFLNKYKSLVYDLKNIKKKYENEIYNRTKNLSDTNANYKKDDDKNIKYGNEIDLNNSKQNKYKSDTIKNKKFHEERGISNLKHSKYIYMANKTIFPFISENLLTQCIIKGILDTESLVSRNTLDIFILFFDIKDFRYKNIKIIIDELFKLLLKRDMGINKRVYSIVDLGKNYEKCIKSMNMWSLDCDALEISFLNRFNDYTIGFLSFDEKYKKNKEKTEELSSEQEKYNQFNTNFIKNLPENINIYDSLIGSFNDKIEKSPDGITEFYRVTKIISDKEEISMYIMRNLLIKSMVKTYEYSKQYNIHKVLWNFDILIDDIDIEFVWMLIYREFKVIMEKKEKIIKSKNKINVLNGSINNKNDNNNDDFDKNNRPKYDYLEKNEESDLSIEKKDKNETKEEKNIPEKYPELDILDNEIQKFVEVIYFFLSQTKLNSEDSRKIHVPNLVLALLVNRKFIKDDYIIKLSELLITKLESTTEEHENINEKNEICNENLNSNPGISKNCDENNFNKIKTSKKDVEEFNVSVNKSIETYYTNPSIENYKKIGHVFNIIKEKLHEILKEIEDENLPLFFKLVRSFIHVYMIDDYFLYLMYKRMCVYMKNECNGILYIFGEIYDVFWERNPGLCIGEGFEKNEIIFKEILEVKQYDKTDLEIENKNDEKTEDLPQKNSVCKDISPKIKQKNAEAEYIDVNIFKDSDNSFATLKNKNYLGHILNESESLLRILLRHKKYKEILKWNRKFNRKYEKTVLNYITNIQCEFFSSIYDFLLYIINETSKTYFYSILINIIVTKITTNADLNIKNLSIRFIRSLNKFNTVLKFILSLFNEYNNEETDLGNKNKIFAVLDIIDTLIKYSPEFVNEIKIHTNKIDSVQNSTTKTKHIIYKKIISIIENSKDLNLNNKCLETINLMYNYKIIESTDLREINVSSLISSQKEIDYMLIDTIKMCITDNKTVSYFCCLDLFNRIDFIHYDTVDLVFLICNENDKNEVVRNILEKSDDINILCYLIEKTIKWGIKVEKIVGDRILNHFISKIETSDDLKNKFDRFDNKNDINYIFKNNETVINRNIHENFIENRFSGKNTYQNAKKQIFSENLANENLIKGLKRLTHLIFKNKEVEFIAFLSEWSSKNENEKAFENLKKYVLTFSEEQKIDVHKKILEKFQHLSFPFITYFEDSFTEKNYHLCFKNEQNVVDAMFGGQKGRIKDLKVYIWIIKLLSSYINVEISKENLEKTDDESTRHSFIEYGSRSVQDTPKIISFSNKMIVYINKILENTIFIIQNKQKSDTITVIENLTPLICRLNNFLRLERIIESYISILYNYTKDNIKTDIKQKLRAVSINSILYISQNNVLTRNFQKLWGDIISTEHFFKDNPENMLRKFKISGNVLEKTPEYLAVFLERMEPSQIFFVSATRNMDIKIKNLKRICWCIGSCSINVFESFIPRIMELIAQNILINTECGSDKEIRNLRGVFDKKNDFCIEFVKKDFDFGEEIIENSDEINTDLQKNSHEDYKFCGTETKQDSKIMKNNDYIQENEDKENDSINLNEDVEKETILILENEKIEESKKSPKINEKITLNIQEYELENKNIPLNPLNQELYQQIILKKETYHLSRLLIKRFDLCTIQALWPMIISDINKYIERIEIGAFGKDEYPVILEIFKFIETVLDITDEMDAVEFKWSFIESWGTSSEKNKHRRSYLGKDKNMTDNHYEIDIYNVCDPRSDIKDEKIMHRICDPLMVIENEISISGLKRVYSFIKILVLDSNENTTLKEFFLKVKKIKEENIDYIFQSKYVPLLKFDEIKTIEQLYGFVKYASIFYKSKTIIDMEKDDEECMKINVEDFIEK